MEALDASLPEIDKAVRVTLIFVLTSRTSSAATNVTG